MRETFTGLKTEHATAVYKNYLKGDPPFKPQKGNFGSVSWFAGTGNPYVGGQTQSYTVKVKVLVPDVIQLLAKDFFDSFKAEYTRTNRVNLKDKTTHKEFWVALGRKLEDYEIVEVTVPQCEVSLQGAGTFIVANAVGRMKIQLADPKELARDLRRLRVNVDGLWTRIDARNKPGSAASRGKSFTLQFASVQADLLGDTAVDFIKTLLQHVSVPGVVPATINGAVAKPDPGGPVGSPSRRQVTLTLTYTDYSVARQQAKRWAMVQNHPKVVNALGGMTITGGEKWSAKATRSYTAQY